jgi:hypothetical protein
MEKYSGVVLIVNLKSGDFIRRRIQKPSFFYCLITTIILCSLEMETMERIVQDEKKVIWTI